MATEVELPAKLAFLFQPARYKVAYGGRGAAKSWGFARALLIQGAAKPLRILCAREIQNSIADSVHRLLSDQIVAMGLEDFYSIQKTEIVGRNGTQFLFAGLRDQDVAKIKSFEGCDRCWVEEAQAVGTRSWEILVPTIRKPDSEIWISFNPELDSDPTYTRFVVDPPAGAVVVPINWHDNPWFPPVLMAEKDDLLRRDPDAHANVWEGKCRSAVEGAIYLREIEQLHKDGRVRNVPYDPILKVHTVWDLGWNDALTVIMVQRSGSELRILDYIEDSHRTLADYVADLRDRRYAWGTDWIPHDGAARDFKTGKSTEEVLRNLGRNPRVIPIDDVEEGIKAARMVFPRCYFDKDKAQRLLHCLKRYRRTINKQTDEAGSPLHDEFSHGADAFRYMATIADQMTNSNDRGPLIDMTPKHDRHTANAWLR